MAVRIYYQLVAIAVYTDQAPRLNLKAGLFEYFTPAAFFDRFTCLHLSTRQAPQTVVHAPGKKDLPTIFIEDDGTGTNAEFAILAYPISVNNLCHVNFLAPIPSTLKGWADERSVP
jgi:hypothetical protein